LSNNNKKNCSNPRFQQVSTQILIYFCRKRVIFQVEYSEASKASLHSAQMAHRQKRTKTDIALGYIGGVGGAVGLAAAADDADLDELLEGEALREVLKVSQLPNPFKAPSHTLF